MRNIIIFFKSILYKYYQKAISIDDKTILFSSFMGRKYACSPKFIYEQLLHDERFKDFTFIWAFKDEEKVVAGAKTVKYNSKEYYKACAQAKYIFDNSRLPDVIKLKKDQIFTQCWHGTPLKRLGYDIEIDGGNALNSKSDLRDKYASDAKKYTNLVSPSQYTTEKLSSAFNLEENNPDIKIIEEGYPRNDFLSNYKQNDIITLKEKLNIPEGKKVILYAPTWRDNQHTSGVGYTYDLGVDFDELKERVSDQYVILFRPHYFIANKFDFKKYKDFVYDVSDYDEISELYVISDILITDYSSVFFDYSILKRKMIFYMYDLDEYQSNIRDFYISLEELPGDIVKTQEDMIASIFNEDIYSIKYQEFNKKYNLLEDGNASKRVVEEVFKCIL